MKTASFHILRVGLAITFLWIGILIFKSPEAWGGYLQPWAFSLLPVPIKQAMISTAVFDIAVGTLLLVDVWTWLAALAALVHLALVLTVAGINEITVRDIGLLTAAFALLIDSFPPALAQKVNLVKK